MACTLHGARGRLEEIGGSGEKVLGIMYSTLAIYQLKSVMSTYFRFHLHCRFRAASTSIFLFRDSKHMRRGMHDSISPLQSAVVQLIDQ